MSLFNRDSSDDTKPKTSNNTKTNKKTNHGMASKAPRASPCGRLIWNAQAQGCAAQLFLKQWLLLLLLYVIIVILIIVIAVIVQVP